MEWGTPEKPADVSAQQWNAYLRRRAKCPMFADDPDLVRPPRTRAEQEEYRKQQRSRVQRMFRSQRAAALWAAHRWYWRLRNARVDASEIWAATRAWRRFGLGDEYLADALQRLARRHGLE